MKRRTRSTPATWKAVELKIAKYLGTRRTPLSGRNSGHDTSSDTLHKKLYIEIKHGSAVPTSRQAIEKLFIETEEKAIEEEKIPVLVLHDKGRWGGVRNYPAFIRLEVVCPSATIGRGKYALLPKEDTIIQIPLSSLKEAGIDGPFTEKERWSPGS